MSEQLPMQLPIPFGENLVIIAILEGMRIEENEGEKDVEQD